ncbi:MAG: Ig-like domain-containing protein, partial [Clostridia bacterium]|nr:Ig-like domain-containing protein [Clostridia bacterium]
MNTINDEISSLSLNPSKLTVEVGGMQYVTLQLSPASARVNADLTWTYDHQIIDATVSNSGVVVSGKEEGVCSLTVKGDGLSSTCIITVKCYSESYETEPYIYSNYTTVQMTPDSVQQVYVSLYGGDASDIDGYTWTADNNSVVDLTPNGQYCQIKAKAEGYARVKISHVKAAYPYYIGVYAFADISKTCYLTSNQNIVTLSKTGGEVSISVSLVNDTSSGVDGVFSWQILDDDGSFSITSNKNEAILTPNKKGQATLRVNHTRAKFPFDFVVRTIEIVENVTIKTSESLIYVKGSDEPVLKCTLDGYKGSYSPDEFDFDIKNTNVVQGIVGGGEL